MIYRPRGACAALIRACEPEVLIAGAAGTGKSRACLEKLNMLALQYPGSRQLILRKKREDLTESGLVTFERDVLGSGHLVLLGASRRVRKLYQYPNGSEIVVAGLFSSGHYEGQKIMSAEYDTIYVQEATELSLEEWERASTRLRNGRTCHPQLLADCNPDTPTHWLYQRCLSGKTRLLTSVHKDNPRWWDGSRWTEDGQMYLSRLEQLSGTTRERLLLGQWCASEGLIYNEYEPASHIVDVPPAWRDTDKLILSVDFGYHNPLVVQAWHVRDDVMTLAYEYYHTQQLVEDCAREVLEQLRGYPRPFLVVCDHDAEGRATFERYTGLKTVKADKRVLLGIQNCQVRFRSGRLRFFRYARKQQDKALLLKGLPTQTLDELSSYVWDSHIKKEQPLKVNDHGMDAMRYAVQCMERGGLERWAY